MRPWTLPIVGVVALSLAVPSDAEARPRFGPLAVLSAFAGAIFGGFHASRHQHRRTAIHASARPRHAARFDRRPAVSASRPLASAPPPATNPPAAPGLSAAPSAAIFWPNAA